jgi:hypothetical protein
MHGAFRRHNDHLHVRFVLKIMISLKVQITCVVERIEQGLDHGLPCVARLAEHGQHPDYASGNQRAHIRFQ